MLMMLLIVLITLLVVLIGVINDIVVGVNEDVVGMTPLTFTTKFVDKSFMFLKEVLLCYIIEIILCRVNRFSEQKINDIFDDALYKIIVHNVNL